MAKSCPVTREEFRNGAQAVKILVNNVEMEALPKEFSTGSFGWFLTGKIILPVGEKKVNVQIGLNLTVIGSKEQST
jgi:hypothetical protein